MQELCFPSQLQVYVDMLHETAKPLEYEDMEKGRFKHNKF